MEQAFDQKPASPSLLEPVSTPPNEPRRCTFDNFSVYKEDITLYMEARALLDDMVRVGNPASKDHRYLLSDVEEMVAKVMSCRRNSMPAIQEADLNGEYYNASGSVFDGILDEQIWYDMDWESILKGWDGNGSYT